MVRHNWPTYIEDYVGVIALVLAVTAVALRRRNPEIVAFGAVVLIAGICFVTPMVQLIQSLPLHVGQQLNWSYTLLLMPLPIAILAGAGTDVLVRSHEKRAVQCWVGGGFLGTGVLVVAVWMFGRGDLPAAEARIRAQSFIWPTIEAVVGLLVVGTLVVAHRRAGPRQVSGGWTSGVGRWAVVALIGCETAFLVVSGAPVMSSSPTFAGSDTGSRGPPDMTRCGVFRRGLRRLFLDGDSTKLQPRLQGA